MGLKGKIAGTTLALGLVTTAGVGGYVWETNEVPGLFAADKLPPPQNGNGLICTANGKCTRETALGSLAIEPQDYTRLENISKAARDAILASEDRRFYKKNSNGCDGIAVMRAFIKNNISSSHEGGSGITRQLVSKKYKVRLGLEKLQNPQHGIKWANGIGGKGMAEQAYECTLAMKLQEDYTKEYGSETAAKNKIYEELLNDMFYGRNANDIGTASRVYVGKSPDKLTLEDGMIIAATFTAPSRVDMNYGPEIANDKNGASYRKNFGRYDNFAEQVAINKAAIKKALEAKGEDPKASVLTLSDIEIENAKKGLEAENIQNERKLLEYEDVIKFINQQKARGKLSPARAKQLKNWAGYDFWLKEATLFREKHDVVVDKNVRAGNLTPERAAELKDRSKPIRNIKAYRPPSNNNMERADQLNVRHFTDVAIAETLDIMAELDLPDELQDYTVITTLDTRDQTAINKALDNDPALKQANIDGAAVMVAEDGATTAMRGGKDYKKLKVNLATRRRRDSGSTLKPFWLADALRKGRELDDPYFINKKNFGIENDGKYWLVESGKDACEKLGKEFPCSTDSIVGTAKSINTVFGMLVEKYGIDGGIGIMKELGVDVGPKPYPVSAFLGSFSEAPSLLGIANGYRNLVLNQGMGDKDKSMPFTVRKIIDKNDKVVYEFKPPKERRVISTTVATDVTRALIKTVIDGTASGTFSRRYGSNSVAAKTGTGNERSDARVVAIRCDKKLGGKVLAIWYGNPNSNESIGLKSRHAAEIAGRIFAAAPHSGRQCDLTTK